MTRETLTSSYLRGLQKRALVLSLTPAMGFGVALATLPWHRPTAVEFALFSVTYVLNSIGIEVGFHRYFSHHAFRARRWVRILLAVLGSSAAQGSVTYWVSLHRRHHKYSDRPGDPHSPHVLGNQELRGFRGFWHGHAGWIMDEELTNPAVFARELIADRDIIWVNRYYGLWVVLGLVVPAALVGLYAGSVVAALYAVLWTGFVRLFFVHQFIFAVNSLCHMYGERPFEVLGHATNNAWLALLSLGGAWHNNHHAFPRSATTAIDGWQLDPGSWFVTCFEWFGFVDEVQRPTRAQIEARRLAGMDASDLANESQPPEPKRTAVSLERADP